METLLKEKYDEIISKSKKNSKGLIVISKDILDVIMFGYKQEDIPIKPKRPQTNKTIWINNNKEIIKNSNIEGPFLSKASKLWNELPEETKNIYDEKVKLDAERYKSEMEIYNRQINNVKNPTAIEEEIKPEETKPKEEIIVKRKRGRPKKSEAEKKVQKKSYLKNIKTYIDTSDEEEIQQSEINDLIELDIIVENKKTYYWNKVNKIILNDEYNSIGRKEDNDSPIKFF